ncbi:MAG: hypothetical protein ACI4MJ_02285, partial [Aristaeellaceae bacterium]
MKTRQGAALERKKFFADPVMVVTIALLTVLLALFILYPLAMLLLDSVYVRETKLVLVTDVLAGTADTQIKDGAIQVLNKKGEAAKFAVDDLNDAWGYLFAKNGRVLKEGDAIDPANCYVKVQKNDLTLDAFPRIFADYTFNNAFFNTLKLGMITSFGSVI